VDIYPTVLELAGVNEPEFQPRLDGLSLAKLLRGEKFQRGKSMGFWNYKVAGRSMRARLMLEELRREQLAGEINPEPKAGTVDKEYPIDKFPHAAAWISGDWKLHRIPNKNGTSVQFKLFNIHRDKAEKLDLAHVQPERLIRMKTELAAWQKSVLHSLNGGDYK